MTANECSIATDVIIPESCKLGSFVKVYPGVTIGDNVEIGDFCVIGNPSALLDPSERRLHVPDGSVIRSHTIIYAGSRFGTRLTTGHHVVIRERTVAGENLRVGNFSDVEGDCTIGDFCRFHGYVHIGKGSVIGSFVWLYSLVTLTNDPLPPSHIQQGVTIGDGVVVCVGSTLLPGSVLGRGAMVAANSTVTGDVPAAVLQSSNGKRIAISKVRNLEHKLRLPWPNHFSDAYPSDAQDTLMRLKEAISNDSRSNQG